MVKSFTTTCLFEYNTARTRAYESPGYPKVKIWINRHRMEQPYPDAIVVTVKGAKMKESP